MKTLCSDLVRALFVVVVGCGSAVPSAEHAQVPAAKPRASYVVQTGELGDPEIEHKLVHHARLAHHGRVWVNLDAPPTHPTSTPDEAHEIVPIVGETRDRVRVVSTDDDARIALWIDRADVAPTIVAPVEVLDDRGHGGDGVTGVWLEPGADVDVRAPVGELRGITVRDPSFVVTGTVHAASIGSVWVGRVPPPVEHGGAPFLESSAAIFAAPRADARLLAKVGDDMPSVTRLRAANGWTEIEIRRGAMRVRGFAHDRDVVDEQSGLLGHGSGTGHGYGISDTDRFDVAAGACLFDRDGGDVIGVNLKKLVRYGYLRHDAEWARVFIGTAHWGTISASLHRVKHDGDAPIWESCAAH
jgi:hypothetical protein